MGGQCAGLCGGGGPQDAVRLEFGVTEWRTEPLQKMGRDAKERGWRKKTGRLGRDCLLVLGSILPS